MWYRHRHSDLATETTGKQTLVHYLRILVHGMPLKYSELSFPYFSSNLSLWSSSWKFSRFESSKIGTFRWWVKKLFEKCQVLIDDLTWLLKVVILFNRGQYQNNPKIHQRWIVQYWNYHVFMENGSFQWLIGQVIL